MEVVFFPGRTNRANDTVASLRFNEERVSRNVVDTTDRKKARDGRAIFWYTAKRISKSFPEKKIFFLFGAGGVSKLALRHPLENL